MGGGIDGRCDGHDGAGPRPFHHAMGAEDDLLHLRLIGGEDDDEVATGGGLRRGGGDLHPVGAGGLEGGRVHIDAKDCEARVDEMPGDGGAHLAKANNSNAGDWSHHDVPPEGWALRPALSLSP